MSLPNSGPNQFDVSIHSSNETGALCPHGVAYTEMECFYDCSHWTHREEMNPDQVIAQHVSKMEEHLLNNKSNIAAKFDIPYGDGIEEKIDIWGYGQLPEDAPIIAMIHGGYWQFGSRKRFTSMVIPLVQSGALVAVVGYDVIPKSDMDTMVAEISRALQYLDDLCRSRACRGLYVCGASAGAHLAAMGIVHIGKPLSTLKGLFLLSGIYDLVPLIGNGLSRPLNLNQSVATGLSPIANVESIVSLTKDVLIAIVVAQHDSPAFKLQAQTYHNALDQLKTGVAPLYKEIPDEDHFTLVQKLADPCFLLTKLYCNWMNL